MPINRNHLRVFLTLLIALHFPALEAQTQRQVVDVSAEYSRAEILVRNHQWDDGLGILRHILTQEPRNLKALNLAGIACAAKGDTQEADNYFEQSLVIDPHFLPALRNLSISEFNAHQYPSAEKHLMAALEQQPNDPTINLYLGQLAYHQQKYKVAAERLGHAGSLLAHYPVAEAALAVSFLKSNQKPSALELLTPLNPSHFDTESQLQLGVALAETDSNAEAIPYLRAAFEQHPESYDTGFDLALVCVTLEELRPRHYNDSSHCGSWTGHRGA